MLRKIPCITLIAALLLTTLVSYMEVSGWSNGSYSADPANPSYGTHDWVAQHALDWLPQQEKQFFVDNLASYLYGTELPDNGQATDGVGDTGKHHVYYFANGSLQDDASGVRAQEEYTAAINFYNAGNYSEAAKRLGMVAHYVADLGVYAHVMGAKTAWGAEVHHSSYESYVESRTNNYTDDFNSYLVFDNTLVEVSAYNATLKLAYDSTFDDGNGLTCVWMDQNYNWSNPAFKSRSGESLNLAANAVADVLHTFSVDVAIVPEFPSTLAFVLVMVLVAPAVFYMKKLQTKKTQTPP